MITGKYLLYDDRILKVLNSYFPQGENCAHPVKFAAKRKFYMSYLENHCLPSDPIILLNIAPEDIDIGLDEKNTHRWLKEGVASFLPEERQWYKALMSWGLYDTYRKLFPASEQLFSWFSYRTKAFEREPKRGLRIDQILCAKSLIDHVVDAGISYGIRNMEKSSGHSPVWITFDLI